MSSEIVLPRQDRLEWQDYWMLQACVTALRSPDPNTNVGSVIVSRDNRLLSYGYNGTPRGIAPEKINWAREADLTEQTKYPYIAHSELNAVLNATVSLKDSVCYVTLHPCNACAIALIQEGIAEVHYLTNPYAETSSVKSATWMAETVGLKLVQHTWNKQNLQQNLKLLLKNISAE